MSRTTNPILAGYLYKKGVYNTSWKRRYFVLYEDRTMDYFKDKAHSIHGRNKPKGTIRLTYIEKVELMLYSQTKAINETNSTRKGEDMLNSIHPPPSSSNIIQSELYSEYTKCDRPYAFTLLSNARQWKLCAESETELKQWICTLTKLCQGPALYDGYLTDNYSSNRFILYQNKVLNSYKNNKIVRSMDLTRIVYLKYDHNVSIEIALSTNKDKRISLTAPNKRNANEWYKQIMSLFERKSVIRSLYSTLAECVHIVHDDKQMKHAYVAIFRPYIVIFNDESQYESIKNMLFTDRRVLRDYLMEQKCALIPVNENIKLRKPSKKQGDNALVLSNIVGDRKWRILIKSKELLKEFVHFMDVLNIGKHRKRASTLTQSESIESCAHRASLTSLPTIEEGNTGVSA
eukprot:201786_1